MVACRISNRSQEDEVVRSLKENGTLSHAGKYLLVKFHQCEVKLVGDTVLGDGTIGDTFKIDCKIEIPCTSCGDVGELNSTNYASVPKGNRAALEGVCGAIINQMIVGTEKEGDGKGYGLRHIVIGVRCSRCRARMLETAPALIAIEPPKLILAPSMDDAKRE